MTQMSLPFGEPVRGKRVAIAATTVLPAPIATATLRVRKPAGEMVMSPSVLTELCKLAGKLVVLEQLIQKLWEDGKKDDHWIRDTYGFLKGWIGVLLKSLGVD